MSRTSACVLLCILGVGCEDQHTYLIDFSQTPGFEWDGKVKITKTRRTTWGPLLTPDEDWDVDRVEFLSRDGRSASIDTRGYRHTPIATLDLGSPARVEILGTKGYWDGATSVSESTLEPAPHELKPYAKHVDQLALTQWWAIALQEADDVSIEFRVPDEKLRILLRGDPRQYGPAVLEVRTADGRLLKRLTQEQIQIEEVDPDRTNATPHPPTTQP